MLITKKKRRKQLIDLYGDMENFNLSLSCLFFFYRDLVFEDQLVTKETKQDYKERWRSIRILYLTMFFDSLCE